METLNKRLVKNNIDEIKQASKDCKVIYSDVDGTIVGPQGSFFNSPNGGVTIHPARAIIKILQANIDLVLVSGRNRRMLGADARLLGFKNYIAELGCQIVHDLGKNIYCLDGGCDINGSLYESIEKTGAPRLLLEKYKGYLEYHTPWSAGRECTHVFRGFINIEQANNLLEKEGHKSLALIDNGVVHRRGDLNKSIPEIHAYHLLPKNAGKEMGIRKDLQLRKLSKKNAIAIGDALSDLKMANDVSMLFLTNNAISEYGSEIIDQIHSYDNVYVTSNEMGLGFAEIIYTLLDF